MQYSMLSPCDLSRNWYPAGPSRAAGPSISFIVSVTYLFLRILIVSPNELIVFHFWNNAATFEQIGKHHFPYHTLIL